MKFRILVAIFCFVGVLGNSQTKVGSVDSELIIGLMPETKQMMKRLGDYAKKLDSSYQVKLLDYQSKLDAYQKLGDVSDNYKKLKADEINEMNQGLQQSKQNGNQLIQLKRNELMRPLYKKLTDVIAEISKAEGYTQILTTSGNEFAYIDPKFDITQKVMDKLGVKIPEEDKK